MAKTNKRQPKGEPKPAPNAPMKERLLKRALGQYEPASPDAGRPAEITPVGNRILVQMDLAAQVTGGGISLTDDMVERMTMASESGVIVEVGPCAFEFNKSGTTYTGRKPKAGDRVYIEKYAGNVLLSDTGVTYRVMDDTCICAIYDAPIPAKEPA